MKPDFDNVLKAVVDGMQWLMLGDEQIVGVHGGSGKYWRDRQ